MKMRLGKIAAFFVAGLLCCCAFGVTAFAADDSVALEYSWVSETDSAQNGSATAADFTTGWNEAMSKSCSGYTVTVKLHTDRDKLQIKSGANMILDLNGHTIDRGLTDDEDKGEVIRVESGANVTIKNGTITGGFSNGGGGGVHIENANVVIKNVTIEDCNVKNDDGLAVHLNKGSLVMEDCILESNDLDDYSLFMCYGTIHAVDAEKVEIRNTTVAGVEGLSYGGVLNCDNVKTLIVEDCTFMYGQATQNGGGFWLSDIDTAEISNSTFTGCAAGGEGGAIWANEIKNLTISDCTFTRCEADDGGALYIEDCKAPVIKNCKFSSNSADDNGGACYLYDNPDISVEDCFFFANSAGGQGGAVYTDSFEEKYDLDNRYYFVSCLFANNTSDGDGGAFYISGDGVSMIGGGSRLSYVYFDGCEFLGNISRDQGGAIYLKPFNGLHLTDTFITQNDAERQGGGVYAGGESKGGKKGYTLMSGNVVVRDNVGTDGRIDNFYICKYAVLNFSDFASENNAIGLRHPGGSMYIGEYLEPNVWCDALFSDNPEWEVYQFCEDNGDGNYTHYVNLVESPAEGPKSHFAPTLPEGEEEETTEDETPAEETPAEETPAEETPAEETTSEETPVEETPAEETTSEETPAEEPSSEVTSTEETSEEEISSEESSVEETPEEEASSEESSTEETPAEEPSSEVTSTEAASSEETVSDETASEETSVDETAQRAASMFSSGWIAIVLAGICCVGAAVAYVIRAKKKGK